MLTPFFDVAGLVANSQKILLSTWLHSKLISSLKSLSNWWTMFWVIPQEQDSIKTLEFAETNSYFYIFTYQKNIYLAVSSSDQWVDFSVNLLAVRKAVDLTPKYFLLAWNTNQASVFSPCIRCKWIKSIDWSTKLSLTRQGLIYKTPVCYLFDHWENWKVQSRATLKIPVINICVNWGK